jgi:hypothetical protein
MLSFAKEPIEAGAHLTGEAQARQGVLDHLRVADGPQDRPPRLPRPRRFRRGSACCRLCCVRSGNDCLRRRAVVAWRHLQNAVGARPASARVRVQVLSYMPNGNHVVSLLPRLSSPIDR